MSTASDATLLALVADGDLDAAVGLLYDRHGATVWAAALAGLGDPAQAEQVTIGVFQWMTRHAARLSVTHHPLGQVLLLEVIRRRLELERVAVPTLPPVQHRLVFEPA